MPPSVGSSTPHPPFPLHKPAHLLLPLDDVRELRVGDARVQLALHERRALVVFDVAQVAALRHLDVLGEALRRPGRKQISRESRWREEEKFTNHGLPAS